MGSTFVLFYRLFGLIANIALIFNLMMILAIMSVIGSALTLPGIAGIVLTIGMAVDANVLIFERIREELARAAGYQPVPVAENLPFEKYAAVTVRLPELPGVSPLRSFSRSRCSIICSRCGSAMG